MSLNFLKFKKGLSRTKLRGFTTLELMVVISIFVIMTSVVLANLPKFRDQSSVSLVAQQIALVARQAQVYGNSGRAINGSKVQGYGLYINTTDSSISFVLFGNKFVDENGDGKQDDNEYTYTSDELAERFTLQGGIRISGLAWCDSTCATMTSFVVLFRRSYPDASFYNTSSGTITNQYKSCGIIRVQSVRDANLQKDVVIWSTGHIHTKDVPSDNSYSC